MGESQAMEFVVCSDLDLFVTVSFSNEILRVVQTEN